jgi:RNA polymerase primary sigma factor
MSEKKPWTEDDVLKIMAIMRNLDAMSLNEPISNETEKTITELGDMIEDTGPGPQELLEQKDRVALLRQAVKYLKPREQMIITMRYGLLDGNFKTLDECGQYFGVSRERIRQVETKAIRKLKWVIKCKYKLKWEDV